MQKTFFIHISFQGLVRRPQVASLSLWYCEKQINSIFLENGLEMLEKYFDISVIEIFFRAPVHRWLVWASSIVRADYNVSCRATAARTSCTDPSYVEKSNHEKRYNGKNKQKWAFWFAHNIRDMSHSWPVHQFSVHTTDYKLHQNGHVNTIHWLDAW